MLTYYLTILVQIVFVESIVGAGGDILTFVLTILDSLHTFLHPDHILVRKRFDNVLNVEGRLVVIKALPVVNPAFGQLQLASY